MASPTRRWKAKLDVHPHVQMPAFVDMCSCPQIPFERTFLLGEGSDWDTIGSDNDYLVEGGREDPVFGYDVRFFSDDSIPKKFVFPATNVPATFVPDAADPGLITGTADEFGAALLAFYDADDRMETVGVVVEARIRILDGTSVSGGTLNMKIGEKKILTFYADPFEGLIANQISWTDPAGSIINRVGDGMVMEIEAIAAGSGTLSVTGWVGSDSVTITVT